MSWAIAGKGTFAALGITNCNRSLVNGAMDEVTFEVPVPDATVAALFAYKEPVTITKDGVAWFTGINLTLPRVFSPDAERITYRIVGPWWYLEQCVYQQTWKMWDATLTPPALADMYKSRVILNQTAAGARLNSGQQIVATLNYAISRGASLQVGTVDPAVQIPWEEVTDVTCAEVITRMLRWSPDCVTFFDYTTTPPTMHVRKRSNLASVSIALAGPPANQLNITPRNDLVVPGVLLRYESTSTVDNGDGTSTVTNSTTQDAAGDITALDTLISTIGLAGSSIRYKSSTIKIRKLPSPLSGVAFWKRHVPILKQFADGDITIANIVRARAETTELVEGTLEDWVIDEFSVAGGDDEITADVTIQLRNGGAALGAPVKEKHTIRLVTCDATGSGTVWNTSDTTFATVDKTYRVLDSADYGESTPVGVAAMLYASLSTLHYDGSLVLLQSEVASGLSVGNVLNITGGLSAWSAMNALVQQVQESVDDGRTRVVFGPPKHLTLEDILALLRAFRVRTRAAPQNHAARVTGASAAEEAQSGGTDSKNETSSVPSVPQLPPGGTANQVLSKKGTDDYDVEWKNGAIPAGGLDGQVLVKKSNADFDVEWDWVRVH